MNDPGSRTVEISLIHNGLVTFGMNHDCDAAIVLVLLSKLINMLGSEKFMNRAMAGPEQHLGRADGFRIETSEIEFRIPDRSFRLALTLGLVNLGEIPKLGSRVSAEVLIRQEENLDVLSLGPGLCAACLRPAEDLPGIA